MFTYRCPSCGKQHVAEKEPEAGFTATCLRCRGAIQVPGPALAAAGAPPSRSAASKEAPPKEAPAEAGAAEAEQRKQGITRQPAQGKNGKPAPKKDKKAIKEPEPEAEDDEAVDPAPPAAATPPPEEPKKEAKPGPRFAAKPPSQEGIDPKYKLIAAAVAAVLVLGVGGYFLFAGKKQAPKPNKPAPRKTASKAKPTGKDKPPPPKKDKGKPPPKVTAPAKVEPVFKAANARVYHLSAARLSNELAEDSLETNAKYFGSTIVVTGKLARMEPRESIKPPARLHAVFEVAGRPVIADPLGGPTPEKDWKALKPGAVFTVRGAYSRDGLLHGCQLFQGDETASPDHRYKGKEIELSGFVQKAGAGAGGGADAGGFPTLTLERETNGTLDAICYFPKTEAEEVKKLKPGDPVVVRGTCNGRKGKTVRLDNCKLTPTSAPEDTTPRVEVVVFLREYEEDLFPALRPPPGKEERVEREFTPRDVHKKLSMDPKAWEWYRGKVVTVSGSVLKRDAAAFTLTLGFEDTDKSFKILCKFRRKPFEDVDESATFNIRGVCTRMADAQTLQLDNCEVDNPAAGGDKRRVTAAFLPHTAGQNVTYDVSTFQELTEAAIVRRLVCLQKENGITTTLLTHQLSTSGHSLFEGNFAKVWVKYRNARRLKSMPGPTFIQRLNGRCVEVGEVTRPGAAPTSWEPVLKVGARLQDSWKWTDKNVFHTYKVFKFDQYKGRRSVTIYETIKQPTTVHNREVRHLYVEGLGEVERQEVLRISPSSTRVLSEKKLVEDDAAPPVKSPKR